MMRGWRSAFLFGGLAAAVGLLPGLTGCTVTPLDSGEDTAEEVEEVASDLDFNAPDSDPEVHESDGSDPAEGESEGGPDPVPWRPNSAVIATSQGAPVPPCEMSDEPDPVPWAVRLRGNLRGSPTQSTSALKP